LEIACCVSKIDLGEQASAARGEEIVVKNKKPTCRGVWRWVSYEVAMEGRLENWSGALTTKRSGHCRGTTVTTTRGGRSEE
jgi:hypothetical protein